MKNNTLLRYVRYLIITLVLLLPISYSYSSVHRETTEAISSEQDWRGDSFDVAIAAQSHNPKTSSTQQRSLWPLALLQLVLMSVLAV
ncbi:MAG: hypothetical protein AAFU67_18785, partial [Bacteroidota bacterium]